MIAATFLAPNMYPVYAAITAYIGRQLDYPTHLIVGSSLEQLATQEIDLAFVCGLPYVELARQTPPPVEPLVAPVLSGERYGGRPIYFSDVIVHRASPFRAFADLRGASWAYNDPDSHSGYNTTRYHLLQQGQTRGFFGRVVEAGFHQHAIRLVAAGEVDAAAIDSQVLAIELRDHPVLAESLRVIEVLGPATIQPVVVGRHVPPSLKSELREIFLRLSDDPAMQAPLAHGFIDCFTPMDDSSYNDIRAMLGAAEAAGFLTLA